VVQGAVANVDDYHVSAAMLNDCACGATAALRLILDKFKGFGFLIRNHQPWRFTEMRRHQRIGFARSHHYRNLDDQNISLRASMPLKADLSLAYFLVAQCNLHLN